MGRPLPREQELLKDVIRIRANHLTRRWRRSGSAPSMRSRKVLGDGHPVHRFRAVKPFVISAQGRLRLFFLPPCSPEGSPGERVGSAVRNYRAGHAALRSKAGLKGRLVSALFAASQDRKLLRAPRHALCSGPGATAVNPGNRSSSGTGPRGLFLLPSTEQMPLLVRLLGLTRE